MNDFWDSPAQRYRAQLGSATETIGQALGSSLSDPLEGCEHLEGGGAFLEFDMGRVLCAECAGVALSNPYYADADYRCCVVCQKRDTGSHVPHGIDIVLNAPVAVHTPSGDVVMYAADLMSVPYSYSCLACRGNVAPVQMFWSPRFTDAASAE